MSVARLSAIVCTHNPRQDYLRRTFRSLDEQTLPKTSWELLVIDNASHERLAKSWDLSWHPRARHVREDALGLTPARLRAIAETSCDLLIFVDDDNVLSPGYLEEALAIFERHADLGAFGAGGLAPEFEMTPPRAIRPYLKLLALRSVPTAQRSSTHR